MPHGEYLLKIAGRLTPGRPAPPAPVPTTAVTFAGRDAQHARRLAIGWWYAHRDKHGLFVRDFLARCRMGPDGRSISFYAGRS